jgi:hypothetical protein
MPPASRRGGGGGCLAGFRRSRRNLCEATENDKGDAILDLHLKYLDTILAMKADETLETYIRNTLKPL